MDSEESPLDVLSRAATMVSPPTYGDCEVFFEGIIDLFDVCTEKTMILEEYFKDLNRQMDTRPKVPRLWQPWLLKDEARAYSGKEMPSAKWRRERRQVINSKVIEAPLDFSTRHTNLKPPPSYDQSIQNKMTRPSVIQSVCTASPVTKNTSPDGDSQNTAKSSPSDDACDPAIDEHFRRSLGKDYSSIFSKDNKEFNKSENSESDSTGLTVDDHFAKALGDTWIKLKEKENQEKNSSAIKSSNNRLGTVKDLSNGQSDGTLKKKKKIPKETVLNDKRRAVVTSSLVRT